MKFQVEAIKKYLHGRFSLDDKAAVDEYFTNQQYSSKLEDVLNDHFNNLETARATKDLSPLLHQINHKIRHHSAKQTNTLIRLWQVYAKVAAVLLVPMVIATIYFSQNQFGGPAASWVEVHSPYGARTQFSLPDGSTGWLNSGSVIRYNTQFHANRKIDLNGEAYFDVVKNPRSPFLVHTSSVDIKVLGTSFNIVSYDVDSVAEVVVTSGKVEVLANEKNMKQHLLPNERLVFHNAKGSAEKSVVAVQNYTSWKTGKLIFQNDNLDEVARKLSRFYNVGFTIGANVNRSQSFRAIMEKENLEEVLRYMKLTMSIDYNIRERKTNDEGLVTRREVLITASAKK
jgi:ferric-dicitrate binding protein FerR (iron transport regulator)